MAYPYRSGVAQWCRKTVGCRHCPHQRGARCRESNCSPTPRSSQQYLQSQYRSTTCVNRSLEPHVPKHVASTSCMSGLGKHLPLKPQPQELQTWSSEAQESKHRCPLRLTLQHFCGTKLCGKPPDVVGISPPTCPTVPCLRTNPHSRQRPSGCSHWQGCPGLQRRSARCISEPRPCGSSCPSSLAPTPTRATRRATQPSTRAAGRSCAAPTESGSGHCL
mmetsp:Transcript_88700/g.223344  ORF Transcript_88700/g.223344 Transcript_88700/m.223344 type:complete len:219 (-) Transcript_88700:270-926(-)